MEEQLRNQAPNITVNDQKASWSSGDTKVGDWLKLTNEIKVL